MKNIFLKLNDDFEKITKFSMQAKKTLNNWFNRQNIQIQVEIFKEQKNQFFKLQSLYITSDISN